RGYGISCPVPPLLTHPPGHTKATHERDGPHEPSPTHTDDQPLASVPRYNSITFGSFNRSAPVPEYALRPWSSTSPRSQICRQRRAFCSTITTETPVELTSLTLWKTSSW